MRLAAVLVLVAGIALAGAPATSKKKSKAPAKKADAGAVLEFGTLELDVKGDVTVSLDGKELGKPPLQPVKVLAGKHQLRLVNQTARIDQIEDVEVKPRQVSTFQISLE
jgi:PEGA domain-containing protein